MMTKLEKFGLKRFMPGRTVHVKLGADTEVPEVKEVAPGQAVAKTVGVHSAVVKLRWVN